MGMWMPVGEAAGAENYYGTPAINALYTNASFNDISQHWARAYIYRMAALGVIRDSGDAYRPEALASKEDTLGALMRLGELEGMAQQMRVAPEEEADFQNPWGANYVIMAQRMGIITAEERATLKWKNPATREELAYWMARILNFPPVYGRDQQAVYSFADGDKFDKAKTPYCEAVIGSNIMTGRAAGMFYPRHEVKRGELAAALDKAAEVYLAMNGFQRREGTVGQINSQWSGMGTANRGYYQVIQADGQSFYLIAEPERDFLVYNGRSLGRSSILKTGDSIKVLAKPTGEIVLVEAVSGLGSVLNGTLDYVDQSGNKIYLSGWDGKSYSMNLSPVCRVNLSGGMGQLYDLVPGQEVSLFLTGTQVSEIRSSINYAVAGALPRDTRSAFGKLFRKNPDELSIRDDNGNPYTYSLTDHTMYYVNGLSVDYYDLKTGDYVKLALDSRGRVIRADVRKDEGTYRIYRGTMNNIRDVFKEIDFAYLCRYENEDLVSSSPSNLTLDVADDAEIFEGAKDMTLRNLEKYRGERAYFVTAYRNDKERVIKLTLRGDTERRLTGKVHEINSSLKSFAIKYEPDRIAWDSGTIVVKNNRLIDGGAINTGDNVVVFAERGSGSTLKARVIVVNAPEVRTRYEFYKGVLRDIMSRSKFDMELLDRLEDNKWRGYSSYPEYYYDSNTRFLYVDDSGRAERLNDNQFYNRDEDLLSRDMQMIADGDKALAVVIWDEDIEFTNEAITRGRVVSTTRERMVIDEVSSWSNYGGRWETQPGEMTLDLKYAVAVKNGEGRDPYSLAQGDPVYLLRANLADGDTGVYATLILVE
jgi:hypothetical protein